jgi:hypothetical protein
MNGQLTFDKFMNITEEKPSEHKQERVPMWIHVTTVYAGRASIMQRALLSIRKKCHTIGTRVSFAIYAIILMEKVPKIWKERNAMNM